MRGVVLAAGCCERFGLEYPKPLAKLLKGQSIIRYVVDSMRWLGLDVTVVVGRQPELIMKELAWDVTFVYNPWFSYTSYITSMLIATKAFPEEAFLVAYADTVVNTLDILKVFRTRESILVSEYDQGEDTAQAHVVDGILIDTAPPRTTVSWTPMCFAGYAHVTREQLRNLNVTSDVRMVGLMKGCRALSCTSVNVNRPADVVRARAFLLQEESDEG